MEMNSEHASQIMRFRLGLQHCLPTQKDEKPIEPMDLKQEPQDTSLSSTASDPPMYHEDIIRSSAFHIVPDDKKRTRGRPPKRTVFVDAKDIIMQTPVKPHRRRNSYYSGSPTKSGRKRGRPVKINLPPDVEPMYECARCEYKTRESVDLELHYKTHNENAYPCPYCPFTCSQKGNLVTHLRTHTKEKPFKCMFCDFAASQKVNLQTHLRVHTKEKPYKCQLCDFAAAQKTNLITHVTRRHSNVQTIDPNESYSCTNLWSSDNESQKSYKCGNCNFKCKLKNEMFNHVKLNHPLADLVTCDFKSLLF